MQLFPHGLYWVCWTGSFLLCVMAVKFWIPWCLRHNWLDQPGHRKIHHTPIALAGGLAIGTSLLVVLMGGWCLLQSGQLPSTLSNPLTYGFSERLLQIMGIALGAMLMLVIGLWDDRYQPSAGPKLLAQIGVALLVAASGVRITLFMEAVWLHYLVTCFWILLVVNACNFADNMNGLCSGLSAISALFFAIHSMTQDHYLVASLSMVICGCICGFIPFNYPSASSFLGDAGSHLIGFLMAITSILPHFYGENDASAWVVLAPLPILGIFLIDMTWVVTYRLTHRLPIYRGDNNHLSHQLVARGFPAPVAVGLLWLAQAILGGLSLMLL